MPNLERLNGEEIHASGYKYKELTKKMQRQIEELGEAVGSKEADAIIEEFENDV